jgi:low affinity Fe/Cu permease
MSGALSEVLRKRAHLFAPVRLTSGESVAASPHYRWALATTAGECEIAVRRRAAEIVARYGSWGEIAERTCASYQPIGRRNERLSPMASRPASTFFATFSTRIASWTGSHWALFVGAVLVTASLFLFGVDRTNIAISIVTLLMLFILQNTQNRDSAALHAKLDDLVINLTGPRDELAGIESKSTDEIADLSGDDARALSSEKPGGSEQ